MAKKPTKKVFRTTAEKKKAKPATSGINWHSKLKSQLSRYYKEQKIALTKEQFKDRLDLVFDKLKEVSPDGKPNQNAFKMTIQNLDTILHKADVYNPDVDNLGNGGSITNQYAGKTATEVWTAWDAKQRKHFLYDHREEIVGGKNLNKRLAWMEMDYPELPEDIQNAIKRHMEAGQYGEGGGIPGFGPYSHEQVKNIIKNESIIYAVENFLDAESIEDKELAELWKDTQNKINAFESNLKEGEYAPGLLSFNDNGYFIIQDNNDHPYKEVPVTELPHGHQEEFKPISDNLDKIAKTVGMESPFETFYKDEQTTTPQKFKVTFKTKTGKQKTVFITENNKLAAENAIIAQYHGATDITATEIKEQEGSLNAEIKYYAVGNENTLGYVFDDSDGSERFGILHASVLKGSSFNELAGPLFTSQLSSIRKATEKDFEEYRVSLPPDFAQNDERQYVADTFSLDDENEYAGYHVPTTRWNGWATPVFEEKVAEKILRETNTPYKWEGDKLMYVPDHDPDQNDGRGETWEQAGPKTITVNGEQKTVYAIGAYNWVWSANSDYDEEGNIKADEFAKGGTIDPEFKIGHFKTLKKSEIKDLLNDAVKDNDKTTFKKIWVALYNDDRNDVISSIVMTGQPTATNKDVVDILWEQAKASPLEYTSGGSITDNWDNADWNRYDKLYVLFPDDHKRAKSTWDKMDQADKDGMIAFLNQTDAASEHIAESWLEFVNAKSYNDWVKTATNWDEFKQGGPIKNSTDKNFPYRVVGASADKHDKGFMLYTPAKKYAIKKSIETDDTYALTGDNRTFGFAKNGVWEDDAEILVNTGDVYYIEYLNKEKNFKPDTKEFTGPNAYDDAVTWGNDNLGNFNMDMIRLKREKGGEIETESDTSISTKHEMSLDEWNHRLKIVKPYIGDKQYKALLNLSKGEEKEAGIDIVKRLSDIIDGMPKVYGTEKTKFNDKIVYLHYFGGGSDWYIVEKPDENDPGIAYGYVILNGDWQMAEWGNIYIPEITAIGPGVSRGRITAGIELDFYWTPKPFGEIIAEIKPKRNDEPAEADTESLFYGELQSELRDRLKMPSVVHLSGLGLEIIWEGHKYLVKMNDNLQSVDIYFINPEIPMIDNDAYVPVFSIPTNSYKSNTELADRVQMQILMDAEEKNDPDMQPIQGPTLATFLLTVNTKRLPQNVQSFITTLTQDQDAALIPEADVKVKTLKELISQKYQEALSFDFTQDEIKDAIAGLQFLANDGDQEAIDAIGGLKLLLD